MSKTLEEQKQSLVEMILDFIIELNPQPFPTTKDILQEKFQITVWDRGIRSYWYNFYSRDVSGKHLICIVKISSIPKMFYLGETYQVTLYSDEGEEDLVASITKPKKKIKKAYEMTKEFKRNCRNKEQFEKIEGIDSKIKELFTYFGED